MIDVGDCDVEFCCGESVGIGGFDFVGFFGDEGFVFV